MGQLFLDCDGVLADFDAAATRILGLPPRQYQERHGLAEFWKLLAQVPDFYGTLPLMPDAMLLFDAVRHLDPVILTGCPRGGWAERQKERWAKQHFPETQIITCMAVNKRRHCESHDILVDDTLKHRHLWEEAGGTFVHHRDARITIAKLRALGEAVRPAATAAAPGEAVPAGFG